MAYRILIVDDENALQDMVREILTQAGYETDAALSCAQAVERFRIGNPDAVLLDVNLPDGDGFSLFGKLREGRDVPVLFLSARDEDADRLRGLGLGADDYIAKPFDPAELVARVKSHLSRYQRLTGGRGEDDGAIQVGDLRILPQSWKVFKGDQEIKMPNREFALLKFLAENPNIVFSKERLFETIWGYDYVGDSATVTVHIGRIRDKIEDDPAHPKIIETVWGAGYRLNR